MGCTVITKSLTDPIVTLQLTDRPDAEKGLEYASVTVKYKLKIKYNALSLCYNIGTKESNTRLVKLTGHVIHLPKTVHHVGNTMSTILSF